jgi:uroporphyrinogen decarboxylase
MAATLTGRERVRRLFARQDHDRVPRHESFWSDTIERWQREGLLGDASAVLDMLETDFHSLNWLWPQAFPGQERLVEQNEQTRVVRDGNGKLVRYWRGRMGTPEHLGFECDSRERWETIFKPALLDTGLQCDPNAAARAFRLGRERGRWCHLTGVESFEETRSLMGDEITLMAMVEEPEWIVDVSRTFTNVMLRNLDAMMSTGIEPDGLWIYGDMAFKTATMCSPQMYRDLIWPDHKRMADWAHAHNMKFIYHTDGDINGVLDLYAEAGFDCIQPMEVKASMDVRNVLPKYHKQFACFGNIDVMKMATNDLALIEEEIVSKFAIGKQYRAYIYHSDHSVPPSVSWETYQAIIKLVEKHGQYA